MLLPGAGESILLHDLVWHASGPNRTRRTRRAFTVCHLDADTRCARRRLLARRVLRNASF